MRGTLLFGAAVLMSALEVQAQNITTPDPEGCVDPTGFASCLTNANTTAIQCANQPNANVTACDVQELVDEMLCYYGSCWNKVYTCAYQYLTSEYLLAINRDHIQSAPFFPAPANAPDGCSCNLGNSLINATLNHDTLYTCWAMNNQTQSHECQCCVYSAAVSASYGICPGTDKNILGVPILIQEGQANIAANGSCDALTYDVCYGQYGIPTADNGTYVDVNNLPPNQTQALSNTPGATRLTSPPGGETMTVTFLNKTYTVTAAPYHATSVAATTTATKTGRCSRVSTASHSRVVSSTTHTRCSTVVPTRTAVKRQV
ncbi:hypothetical protein TMatcc_002480 [Talaromyces marneffei ATCC 18224]|uniref:Uncharacterized protein n=1 Tax=Talaromyces marneffei (strain ATCC 18224 / CBS 334.59 / QM 7333) TaxID=441960 RepID=B6QKB3_TALMQ|nr:uncharacterized protein EYB26_006377 [Talaromyces marneffei]EEA23607.1 conserved hypothetical protein [Talaromyces marneffei ATCC 18224]KAE8552435.1 hypothetical protein EYB25_006329 [Talaromyces marneffei]QGA18692.1 hypothetical protein EYB26_006377 [Talaromyces marneffei]